MSARPTKPDGRRRRPMLLAAVAYAVWVAYLVALAVLHRLG
jgi:hypothetical protein